ncbi:MAG TPA: phage tail tube protein [Mycobacteriales bacterium]|nr:phage tail tube protein [Mycobacteriales bacterium]
MAIGTGIGAQLGVCAESTVGTINTTGMRFYEFNSETLSKTKNIVQGMGLHSSGLYTRSSRRAYTTRTAGGQIVLDIPTKGAGLLLKQMLGSSATAVQQGATPAYKQDHAPGAVGQQGMALTVQVGRPQTDGTVKPFTLNGCKVSDWEIACAVGGIPALTVTLDAWDQATATGLQTASYTSGTSVFNFTQGTLLLGGTPSTASGVTSIAGGVAVANVKAASVKGTNSLATDRYFFGSAGLKAEQVENGYRSIGGSLECEFVNQATVYDVFAADTSLALELKFVGANISGIYNYTLDVIVPVIYFDTAPVNVSGPDIVSFSADFTGLDDGTNNPVQLSYTSTDTSV